jgi:NADH dehydrogenase
MKHLVILGGGFSGVWAAMAAASQRFMHSADGIKITLISNNEGLCIRPRLYEEIHPSMLVPLLPLMNEINVNLIIDDVESIERQNSITCKNQTLPFDKLIFALGSKLKPLEIKGSREYTYNIDTYNATKALNNHIEKLVSNAVDKVHLHIIGSGFTGIELITKLHQRYKDKVSLTLVERADSVAKSLGGSLHSEIMNALEHANVDILLAHEIESFEQNLIKFKNGQLQYTDAVILSTGLVANPLTHDISKSLDSNDRIIVKQTLQLPENDNVFIAGDSAKAKVDDEHYSLMSCQHAMPMGTSAGVNAINAFLDMPLLPYRQEFYATCLDLGESGAVFTQGWERNIAKKGSDGAQMKAQINNQWIYPPSPSIGKSEIFNLIQSTLMNK